MDGAIHQAQRLAALEPDRYWYADQYSHPANPRAHFCTTAEEIWRQTDGRVTHLVAGLGTTGTLTGTGRRLKQLNPAIQLVAVQPDASFHGLEGLKYLAAAMVPEIYDPLLPDHHEFVTTEAAETTVRRLAREAGLLVGWSTGAAVWAAGRLLARLNNSSPAATVVVIAPDSGARYLSAATRLLGASE
jgi:cysteine synthase B